MNFKKDKDEYTRFGGGEMGKKCHYNIIPNT